MREIEEDLSHRQFKQTESCRWNLEYFKLFLGPGMFNDKLTCCFNVDNWLPVLKGGCQQLPEDLSEPCIIRHFFLDLTEWT